MEKSTHLIENYNKYRKESTFKECIYRNIECSNKIIKAHSIQNNKILNKLSLNGNVLYFDFGDLYNVTKFKNIGRKKATTFSGFCSYHDSSIFSPIENYDYEIGNREQEFLFAYRAFARGYATKKTAINLLGKINEVLNPRKLITKEAQLIEIGLNRTMFEFEKYKQVFNISLKNKDYYRIKTDVIIFDIEYSFAVSAAFFLLGDLKGNMINNPLNLKSKVAPFFLNIFPENGKTIILMSYFNKDKHRYSFIKDQIVNNNIENQQVILSNLVVVNSENIVFSPEKFNNLEEAKRNELYEILKETSAFQPGTLAPFPELNIFV
ncbi:hypothetical protein PPYC1_07935 [Paenibacillus polymyxa]|uniref:hypothetical protein n=1 Tax=Paenibacillus polymyxa TaxID=1406 RepID=UPI0008FC7EE0|nr:hypothetical protein [Paenibacillus polymyxa]APB70282.1 hypothetical protein PPYC1_07935 [Paenibacillus polymyxa]